MVEYNFLNFTSVVEAFKYQQSNDPFNHVVIDNFFVAEIAEKLSKDFFPYHSSKWTDVKNLKTCNNWNDFPPLTYSVFSYFCGEDFTRFIQGILGSTRLYPDPGLQNSGLVLQQAAKKSKPICDHNLHNKLNLQKILNLIIYLSPNLKEEHGGNLGLWSCDAETKKPTNLVKEIAPVFNRAVLFYTDQDSFYGTSKTLKVPEGVYKKSLIISYFKEN